MSREHNHLKKVVHEYYGHGKVLLTAEYGILDGAKAIALPTKLGQHMKVKNIKSSDIYWKAENPAGESWFEAQISLYDFSSVKTTDEAISKNLQKLLKNAVRLNSEFLSKWNGFRVTTKLEFEKDWGLGSSSTLTHLVAEWAGVHPMMLHFKVSDGSGYDVACAGAEGPIEYQLVDDEINYTEINFDPKFKNNLYFVYLGRKQSSDASIKDYFKRVKSRKSFSKSLNKITEETIKCTSLSKFCELIEDHEGIVSKAMGLPMIKDKHFSDYWGCIKSLGGWGGDFALVVSSKSTDDTKAYFQDKGFDVCYPYVDFIL